MFYVRCHACGTVWPVTKPAIQQRRKAARRGGEA